MKRCLNLTQLSSYLGFFLTKKLSPLAGDARKETKQVGVVVRIGKDPLHPTKIEADRLSECLLNRFQRHAEMVPPLIERRDRRLDVLHQGFGDGLVRNLEVEVLEPS